MLAVLLVSFICVYLLFRCIIFLVQHAKKRKEFSRFPQLPSNFLLGDVLLLLKHRPFTHRKLIKDNLKLICHYSSSLLSKISFEYLMKWPIILYIRTSCF